MTALAATHPPVRSPDPGDRAGDRDPEGTIRFRERWLGAGFTSVPNLVLRSPRLNPTAKVVYGLLLSYAWERNCTWPGQEVLAAHMGATTRTVRNALADLKDAGLITVEQRGLRQTNVYWVEPLERFAQAGGPSAEPTAPDARGLGARFRSDRKNSSGQERQKIAAKQDSGKEDSEEHQHPPSTAASAPPDPPTPLAPTSSPPHESAGAVDDDALEFLISHGVTRRIARELAATHSGEMIRQQVEWQRYRPTAKNPVGALVQAIRDGWAPPRVWREAQEHAAAVARQAAEEHRRREEDAAQRREWEQKPPEERIAGRLEFWLRGRRHKGHEPTEAEVDAKRAELLAQLSGGGNELGDALPPSPGCAPELDAPRSPSTAATAAPGLRNSVGLG